MLGDVTVLMLKMKATQALYKVRLIALVIRETLTGQSYVYEVLHPHVLQIYQTVKSIFFFQQDNASIPAIWQGTVCSLVISYHTP